MITKKNIFYKILIILMIACFTLLSVGCLGSPPNEYGDDFDEGDFEDSKVVEMYGTKVLYRPEDYDYNEGSGATEGQENDYYGKYAFYILRDLFRTYGLTNEQTVIGTADLPGRLPNFSDGKGNDVWAQKMISYLYDSIRYQVDTVAQISQAYMVTYDNGQITEISETPTDLNSPIYIVGADTNVKWNWSLVANTTGYGENIKAYAYNTATGGTPIQQDGKVFIDSTDEPSDYIVSNYYDTPLFDSAYYEDRYLTTSDSDTPENDYDLYSQYVKALEYVIYCYAIDLEPAEVRVTLNNDGTYSLTIGDFAPNGDLTSVDVALASAKERFEILGSYVGLVDRQITKIQNWILENIIGLNVVNDADIFTNYSSGVYAYIDQTGVVRGYYFSPSATYSQNALGRDYRTAVENIITGVCELVPIGNDNGEDVTIDQRFLASNVMEYSGNTFFINDDSNFPRYDGGEVAVGEIIPLEYQSVAIMLDQEVYLNGLWVALKYDADNSGTVEGEFGDQYIDIIVDLNYYNHATNSRQVLGSKRVRVYDGPYDMDYLYGFAGTEGPVSDGSVAPEDHCSGVVFDDMDQRHVGEFNVNIGSDRTSDGTGILMTDVGRAGYTYSPLVSAEPLILVGTNDIRKYYEIVEFGTNPEYDTDELEDGYTYISGRFNPEMFSGSDGCDYLEITYKVVKRAGDTDTNYRFYTGIAFMDYSDSPYPY